MSLAMKARQKVRRKGAAKDRVFGCDLLEHLHQSGQEVPQVLKCCTEFVEQHGLVDGIYRLSGVSSNIQKLRQEFDGDRCPDLNKDVYLQDIHCVSSLCKAYFRELPNPLLTYQLYDKFADAVAIQMEEGRLVKIKEVLKELPLPHYRTLEFLMRHLVHMASYSSQTNMHARNLAIVWAPNLLRSKDIEASGFNGTAAFMEVRVQSIVVEFILTHVEQLFRDAPLCGSDRESLRKSLLLSNLGLPGVLPDCQALSYNVPGMLNQGDGPPQIRPYHTIIELSDQKRKGSLKVKKWRSIFNLGRSSNDSKRKLAKPEEKDDKPVKMSLRPAKSMDSLSSVSDANDDNARLGRKRSQKQAPQRRESFNSPSSREESFLESDEYPNGKFKGEEGQQTLESEGEATAKSEPTTPKAGRASQVGGIPQGRSPKTARNRAEKCAGVHISVPFSVTVPFHITSNINLSRLTRGLECPALSYCSLDKEALESSSKEREAAEGLGAEIPLGEEDHMDTKMESAVDLEENRLSLEVQDSFSFLDNPDSWQDCGTEGDQPEKNLLEETPSDFAGDMLDGFPVMDDDMESRFMSLEEFSVEPPPEYLSIEECMNEEQYYLATGCSDAEELSRETDSEDVYLSTYDDLSLLASELEELQQPRGEDASDTLPPERALDGEMAPALPCTQPTRPAEEGSLSSDANGSSSAEEGGGAKVLPAPPDGPPHAPESATPWQSQEAAEKPAGDLRQPEVLEGDVAEAEEDTKVTGGDGDGLESGCSLHRAGPGPHRTDPAPAGKHQGTWALESECHAGDEQLHAQRCRDAQLAPHAPGGSIQEANGRAPDEARAQEGQGGSAPPLPQIKQPESGKGSPQPLATEATPSPSPGLGPKATAAPICDSGHEATTPFLGTGPEATSVPLHEIDPVATAPFLDTGPAATTVPLHESGPMATAPFLGTDPEATTVPLHESGPVATAPFLDAGPAATTVPLHESGPMATAPFLGIDPKATNVPLHESGPETPPWLETSSDVAPWSETASEVTPSLGSGPASPAPGSGPLQPTDPPALPEHVPAELRPDGSAPMRVTSSTIRVQQVKSVPVVPPKPQFAKVPPALKMKTHLGEASTWPKPSEKSCGGGEPGVRKGASLQRQSHPVSLEAGCGGAEDTASNEKSPRPGAESCEPDGASRQKQKQARWRNGGSMSFDTAVALAKERHLAQAPVRRIQTYCGGDSQEAHGAAKAEKPPPFPRPALKHVGQRPLRPRSCTGALLSPEALTVGKHPEACELRLAPSQEPLPFAQEPVARSRLSLPRLGQRPADAEEAAGALQLRRSLAFEIRDGGGTEEL